MRGCDCAVVLVGNDSCSMPDNVTPSLPVFRLPSSRQSTTRRVVHYVGDKKKSSWLCQDVGNNCTPYHSHVDGVLAERSRANTLINIVTEIL
jgi:hypothetical protein